MKYILYNAAALVVIIAFIIQVTRPRHVREYHERLKNKYY